MVGESSIILCRIQANIRWHPRLEGHVWSFSEQGMAAELYVSSRCSDGYRVFRTLRGCISASVVVNIGKICYPLSYIEKLVGRGSYASLGG